MERNGLIEQAALKRLQLRCAVSPCDPTFSPPCVSDGKSPPAHSLMNSEWEHFFLQHQQRSLSNSSNPSSSHRSSSAPSFLSRGQTELGLRKAERHNTYPFAPSSEASSDNCSSLGDSAGASPRSSSSQSDGESMVCGNTVCGSTVPGNVPVPVSVSGPVPVHCCAAHKTRTGVTVRHRRYYSASEISHRGGAISAPSDTASPGSSLSSPVGGRSLGSSPVSPFHGTARHSPERQPHSASSRRLERHHSASQRHSSPCSVVGRQRTVDCERSLSLLAPHGRLSFPQRVRPSSSLEKLSLVATEAAHRPRPLGKEDCRLARLPVSSDGCDYASLGSVPYAAHFQADSTLPPDHSADHLPVKVATLLARNRKGSSYSSSSLKYIPSQARVPDEYSLNLDLYGENKTNKVALNREWIKPLSSSLTL